MQLMCNRSNVHLKSVFTEFEESKIKQKLMTFLFDIKMLPAL